MLCPTCKNSVPAGALHCPTDGAALPVGPEARVGLVVAERYRLERFVGRGRHGDVYFAKHTTVGRPLAVKALRRELMSDATAVARFVQEARSVAALGHPNVVAVVDAGTLPDNTPYLVMEWIEGDSLAAHARRVGPMPPTRAAELVAAIASGLGACHAIGVVHRDLKPDNVVLARTPSGEVPKIVDFGLARVSSADKKLTTHGAVVGDFRYAAPEQLAGAETDARVDIYALGCVFFELVVGRPPSRGEPVAPALGPFAAVAARAFSVQRDARYPTMEAFRTALTDAANGTSATFTVAEVARVTVPKVGKPQPVAKAPQPAQSKPDRPAAPSRAWLLPVVFATGALVAAGIFGAAMVMLDGAKSEATTRTVLESPHTPAPSALPVAPVAAAPTAQPAPGDVAVGTVSLVSRGQALEVRLGDRLLGTTPLRIARPRTDEPMTLTLVHDRRMVGSVVISSRSPDVVEVNVAAAHPQTGHGASHLAPPVPAPSADVAPAPTMAPTPADVLDPWD